MASNKKGFTLIEIVASIFILSIVFTASISIFMAVRTQTIATQARFNAVEAGTQIRDIIISTTTSSEASSWLSTQSGTEINFNKTNCDVSSFECNLIFGVTVNDHLYDDFSVIFSLVDDYALYQVIHFRIRIVYYHERAFELRGIIYATT
jgi:prepilin-type N-terminal cleavage/methylation domain-containing protein